VTEPRIVPEKYTQPVYTAAKAVYATLAAVITFVGILITVLPDGLTGTEVGIVWEAAGAGVATIAGVYGIRNKVKKP
jgi:drug/metabolite transporter (DMT)-like permease